MNESPLAVHADLGRIRQVDALGTRNAAFNDRFLDLARTALGRLL